MSQVNYSLVSLEHADIPSENSFRKLVGLLHSANTSFDDFMSYVERNDLILACAQDVDPVWQ